MVDTDPPGRDQSRVRSDSSEPACYRAPDGGWQSCDSRDGSEPAGHWAPDGGWQSRDSRDVSEPAGYRAPDGGWGYAVCLACFMVNFVNDGIAFSFGLIFVELLDYYDGTKAETAWIFSLTMGVCILIGPLVSNLIEKYSCRTVAACGSMLSCVSYVISAYTSSLHFLYFSLGIMYGVGYGMTYLSTMVIVSEYFEKRRGLATGLVVAGGGIGTFVFSPITGLLIDKWAWRGAVLIHAAISLNCLPCSLLYRPLQTKKKRAANRKPTDSVVTDRTGAVECLETIYPASETNHVTLEQHKRGTVVPIINYQDAEKAKDIACSITRRHRPRMLARCKQLLHADLFTDKAYTWFVVSTFFFSLGFYIPYVYLPVNATGAGMSETRGAWILAALGISRTLGQVVFGYLADWKWVNRMLVYASSLVVCGVSTALVPLLDSYTTLLGYAVVYGTFSGASTSLTPVLLTDIVGIANLSHAFAISNFVGGVATLAGPPFAGWLFDVSGTYAISFVSAGIIMAISGAMLFIVPCIDTRWRRCIGGSDGEQGAASAPGHR